MINASSIIIESPYLSRLDLKTEIQFIEKGQEIIVPPLLIPEGTREIEIFLPRATSADKSLWIDDGSELLIELEFSKDGINWLPAGSFGAIGGVVKDTHPLSKKEFEVLQTEALFQCDFDGVQYRVRSKCDSASSQKISPLILFHSDPAPRTVAVKRNSVGYVSVQKASGGTVTSLTTPTLSIGSGSNRSVSALVGNYYVQTQTAVKFGGSGGTAMNAVPNASTFGSPWARLAGYFLKESEGVTSDGTVYASFSASTGAYLTGISADNAKGIHSGSGVAPTQTTNGATISANVTSAANELVIGAAVTYTAWSSSPTIAVGSGQTSRSDTAIGSSTRMTVSTETAGSSSESTSFNPNDYVSYPFYGESTTTAMVAWSIEEETGGGGDGVGSSSGSATVSGVGKSLNSQAGSASGSATVTGVGSSLFKSVGSSDGVATVEGVGSAAIPAIGSSDGIATVTGVGSSLADGVGSSSGTATVSGTSQSLSEAVGSSQGVGTVSGVGASIADAVGSSTGSSTAEAVGAEGGTGDAVGSASGTSTVSGVGASLADGVGSSSGTSDVQGVGNALSHVGSASGTSTVSGVGASIFSAVGSAQGTSEALGISELPRQTKGGRSKAKLKKKEEIPDYLKRIMEPVPEPPKVKVQDTKKRVDGPVVIPFLRPVPPQPKVVEAVGKTESLKDIIDSLRETQRIQNEKIERLATLLEAKDKEIARLFEELRNDVQDEVVALINAIN